MNCDRLNSTIQQRVRHLCMVAVLVCTIVPADDEVIVQEGVAAATDSSGIEFFETNIRPVLVAHCYECHSHETGKASGGLVLDSRNGWETGGNSGPAIVPGQPDESLLIQAVRYEGFEMPPEERLSDGELALLEEWITLGAPDPRQSELGEIDIDRLWALQPIQRSIVPPVHDTNWPIDELDAFVLARLEQEGLTPSADADRYTLLRRVTLDLTGMPPTPAEIEDFINDSSPDAYKRVVDRLLESPGFGDHWARHWFDLSCYADLADIDGAVLIRDAWRYRDYVIGAFNADKPLDRFIHEQIAGDLLPYDSVEQQREQIIATGYLAIGPWTLQNYIKGQLDADVVDHQIDRIGRTFLGQTISCARCHDHKFDPVPTRDYYALAGVFHSTRTTSYDGPGVWSQITHVTLPELEIDPIEIAQRRLTLDNLNDQRRTLQSELATLILSITGASNGNVLTLQASIAANEQGQQYDVSFEAAPSVWASTEQATTVNDGLQIDVQRSDGSLLASCRHFPGPWSGAEDAQQMQPASFSYTGDGSGDVRIRISSSTPGSGRFGGALDDLIVSSANGVVFAENFDRLEPGSIEGTQADTQLKVLAQARVPDWDGGGINHSHAVDLGEGDFAVQFFGGDTQSLAAVMPVGETEKQAHSRAIELESELQSLSARISELEQSDVPEQALAVRDIDSPANSPIYRRGDFQSHGEFVPRGFLSAVPVSMSHEIPSGSSGRLQLAEWLTDPGNPLTARVLVNRIWHHLFGKGLVRSVDYFGVHGEMPSHPELLDFLAIRLREDDCWSIKTTVRRMVLSRAYQMASTHDSEAATVDPDSRLLWRMPRRRLTAESIRDAMLAASGELDPARGGPSLGLELAGNIVGAGGDVNPATWGGQIADSVLNRRSIYLPFKRERPQGELEILSVFDFPHPSEITGARPETTVATQALFLMNAPFVKHQADQLAERLISEETANESARINLLYLLTVNRPPEADEIETALTFLDQCELDLASNSSPENFRREAWSQLCHALLSSNNFLFRE